MKHASRRKLQNGLNDSYIIFLLSARYWKYMEMIYSIEYLLRPVTAQLHKCVTVYVTVVDSIPTRGIQIFYIFLSSLWCPRQRTALSSATQHAMPPGFGDKWGTNLTLGSLCLPCCVWYTAWNWFIELRLKIILTKHIKSLYLRWFNACSLDLLFLFIFWCHTVLEHFLFIEAKLVLEIYFTMQQKSNKSASILKYY